MSTPDVPGAVAAHGDALHTGCWAEHDDGSYILVEGIENSRVVFEIFDTSKTPPVAYRDAMPEDQFKRRFSWDKSNPASIRWTWHDKTEFPWDAIIQHGLQSGSRPAFGSDALRQAADLADTMERHSFGADDEPEDWTEEADTGGAAARRVARDLGLRGRSLQGSDSNRIQRVLLRLRDGIQSAIDELRS